MLMTKNRSSPATPVRVRSPHSMMMAASKSPVDAIGDLDVGDAGKRQQRRRRAVLVDDVDVLAERAQRVAPSPAASRWSRRPAARARRCTNRCRARIASTIALRAQELDSVIVVRSVAAGRCRVELVRGSARCGPGRRSTRRRRTSARAPASGAAARRSAGAGTAPPARARGARVGAGLVVAERRVEHARQLQVGRDLHAGQRDEADARDRAPRAPAARPARRGSGRRRDRDGSLGTWDDSGRLVRELDLVRAISPGSIRSISSATAASSRSACAWSVLTVTTASAARCHRS